MARACAPTAAQRRALQELIKPTPRRGQARIATGVMVLPVLPGATREEQERAWERMASAHCARLMEASKEDMQNKPEPAL